MKTVLAIILLAILGFDVFMITPFGAIWMFDSVEDGKPCYGILIVLGSVIPAMLIASYLGIIK